MEADAARKLVVRSLLEGTALHFELIEDCASTVLRAAQAIHKTLQRGGKILLFGNGGSAAVADVLLDSRGHAGRARRFS